MRKLMSVLVSTALIAGSFSGAALARRHHRDHDQRRDYVQSYCDSHSRDRDCRDFRNRGNAWGDTEYRGFYQRNYRNNNDAAVAAIFGVVIGAAIAGQGQTSYQREDYSDGRRDDGGRYNDQRGYSHQAACAAAYDTYRAADDTFVGEDGQSYYCRL